MILFMKKTPLTKYIYQNVHHINIEVLEKKPNTCKNISPTFKYLTLLFKLSQILGPIHVFASSF